MYRSVAAQQRLWLCVGERRRLVLVAVAAVVVAVAVGRAAAYSAAARAAALRVHLPQLARRPATRTRRRPCTIRDKDTAPCPRARDVTDERDRDIPKLNDIVIRIVFD